MASQEVGIATGIQQKFSWNAVGLAAISSFIGDPIGGGVASSIGGSTLEQAVVRAAVSNVVTQGIGVATGLQDKFSWTGVAGAAIGAGVGLAAGQALHLDNVAEKFGATSARFVLAAAGKALAVDIAGAATRTLADGSDFGDNMLAALPDAIGGIIADVAAAPPTPLITPDAQFEKPLPPAKFGPLADIPDVPAINIATEARARPQPFSIFLGGQSGTTIAGPDSPGWINIFGISGQAPIPYQNTVSLGDMYESAVGSLIQSLPREARPYAAMQIGSVEGPIAGTANFIESAATGISNLAQWGSGLMYGTTYDLAYGGHVPEGMPSFVRSMNGTRDLVGGMLTQAAQTGQAEFDFMLNPIGESMGYAQQGAAWLQGESYSIAKDPRGAARDLSARATEATLTAGTVLYGGGEVAGLPNVAAEGIGTAEDFGIPGFLSPRQDLHIPPVTDGRSVLTADPSDLLQGLHDGDFTILRQPKPGQVVVDFGKPIGEYWSNGVKVGETRFGSISYGRNGAHIIPANPNQW